MAQKKKIVKSPPARNPFVLLAIKGMQRKGGSHTKRDKVQRCAEKVSLKQYLYC